MLCYAETLEPKCKPTAVVKKGGAQGELGWGGLGRGGVKCKPTAVVKKGGAQGELGWAGLGRG